TAEVTIKDAVVIQDVGFGMNPTVVEVQLQGGLFQSVGIGYSEEMIWNDKGVLANPTLLDYRIPVALDIPKIEVKIVEVPTGEPPFGAKGIGEPPIAAGCAAVVNAIAANPNGARVFQMPATSERILKARGIL
ncbi:MAG: molybdopterin-dependent oxidoreductase, partial [Chloroflexi bacterium]|nr:molybdopterin-dependent oxidoreductase [Chloroflexota bacterium]